MKPKLNPCELNALITAVANHLYATLSTEDFFILNVLIKELSRAMCSMDELRGICYLDKLEKDIKGK